MCCEEVTQRRWGPPIRTYSDARVLTGRGSQESSQGQGPLRRAGRLHSWQNPWRAADGQRKDFLELRAARVGKDDASYVCPVAVTLVLVTTQMQPS